MLNFNTYHFYIFYGFVYAIYLLLRNHNRQNIFLIIASCIFYASFTTRYFLVILLISSLFDYYLSLLIDKTPESRLRKWFLTACILSNLSILGFFKYYNFFIDNVAAILSSLNLTPHYATLAILLPVSISFDTFQKIGYIVDVYKKETKPAESFVIYFLFICFFPRLVAGPIEVASHMLPQFQNRRLITQKHIAIGLHWIILGCFLKVCLSDPVAPLVNKAFNTSTPVAGASTILAFFGFAIQIFGDFAGYTLIARGTAKLMGFSLLENFHSPYLAITPSDFWNRWHISLSSWLRKYLYIPLGGNRLGKNRQYANLLITMSLGGLWHGAQWNFILWGIYHGLLLCAAHALLPKHWENGAKGWLRFFAMTLTFLAVTFSWILFRSPDLHTFTYLLNNGFMHFYWDEESIIFMRVIGIAAAGIAFYHWFLERHGDDTALLEMSLPVKTFTYVFMFISINAIGFNNSPFIYFQF